MDIVLIPGLWLDGSSWDAVVPALQEAGHRTHPLTLPGMESPDADRSGITLRDHVDAVVRVIDSLDPADGGIVLVGHSGGGAIAHGAVDARPDRVARVVYADSWPLGDGGCINDEFPSANGEVPLPDWSTFDDEDLVDLDDDLRTAFRARALPSPEQVAAGRQKLADERRYDVPVTVIACAWPSATIQNWLFGGSRRSPSSAGSARSAGSTCPPVTGRSSPGRRSWGRRSSAGCSAQTPVAPSIRSRIRSAWPACRAYSPIMWL